MIIRPWIRVLSVTFTSTKFKNKLIFGENYLKGKEDLNIDVSINKYMSALKDSATIKINNLTYHEIIRLIDGEYYDVEVKAGYRNTSVASVFKGQVLYISNSLDDRKSNTAIILCASNLVAKYGQSRINLSLNSGINTYTALKYVCKRAGMDKTNISTQLKKAFVQQIVNVSGTPGSWINSLANSNSNLVVNSDSSETGDIVTIWDASKSGGRVFELKESNIQLIGGQPQLDKDGLTLTLIPTLPIKCGDTIQIDNSLINISSSNISEMKENKGYYLDKEGMYLVYEISYSLQNRGSSFGVTLSCKSRNLVSNYMGVTNG